MAKNPDQPSASVHDSDYRWSMRLREIYVERETPPPELMQGTHQIISRQRASPEIDDIVVQEFKDKSRQLQEDAEDEIAQQLAQTSFQP